MEVDPEKFRTLAKFIDKCFPDDKNPQVQSDLVSWAECLESGGTITGLSKPRGTTPCDA